MAKHTTQTDEIQSQSGLVSLRDKLRYNSTYGLGDLADNDLVPKRVINLAAPPEISVLVPAGSSIPTVIDFTSYQPTYGNNPTITVFLVASATVKKPIYDVDVVYTSSGGNLVSLAVNGHDGGSGTTIDDLQIIIKK